MRRGGDEMTRKTDPKPTNKEKDENYNRPGEDKGYTYQDCGK